MSQLRLALVFPGAASLGSYEAGAAFELARCALMARQISVDEPPLIIDVIVGSSAGAITGALLAYILLTDGEPSWLYHAWVTHPQLSELVFVSELNGILSMRHLHELACELLSEPNAPPKMLQASVRYVATLTNLTPLHYRIPILNGRALIASTHRDWKAMVLTWAGAQTPDGILPWNYIARVALASSAFPAVFSAQRLERSAREYIANHVWLDAEEGDLVEFDFTDGGVMHNQPIALAFDALYEPHHIGLIDQEPIDDSEATRIIAVISPSERALCPTKPQRRPKPLMTDVLLSVISARFNVNDVFDDLRGAQKLNSRLRWKALLLEHISNWLKANPEAAASFKEALEHILECIDADMRVIRAQRNELIKGANIRCQLSRSEQREQCCDPSPGFNGCDDREEVESVIKLFNMVLDKVNGTTSKRQVRIELVSPLLLSDLGTPEELLCGEAMGHFAGFLSRQFRENDFRVGIECMRKWLLGIKEIDERLRKFLEGNRTVKVWGTKIERKNKKIIPLRQRKSLGEKTLAPIQPNTILCKHAQYTIWMRFGIFALILRGMIVLLIDAIRFFLRQI